MPIPTTTSTATTARPEVAELRRRTTLFWRVACAVIAVVVALLAAVSAGASLSALYASVARDVITHSRGRSDGTEAARIALNLAPWRTANHLALAQSLSSRRQIDDAVEHARQAARASPADGMVWAYLARLTGARHAPAELQASLYRMALRRSPNTPTLHAAIALDGVLRWRFGDGDLRSLWRNSMAYSLRADRQGFLSQVARLGRDPYLCAANEDHLPIRKWCTHARFARSSCSAAELPAEAAEWCRQAGLRRP